MQSAVFLTNTPEPGDIKIKSLKKKRFSEWLRIDFSVDLHLLTVNVALVEHVFNCGEGGGENNVFLAKQ